MAGQNDDMAYEFEPWREKLRAAIVTSGIPHRALSIKAGLSDDYVRHVIAPSKNRDPITPSIEKLHAIVKALDLSLDDLFEPGELNTSDLMKKMAQGGFARVFSQIADLSPKEQLWMLNAMEQQLELLDRIPTKKQFKSNVLRLRPQDD